MNDNKKIFFGLNVLNDILKIALEDYQLDSIDCLSFNVNLDYVSQLFSKYPNLKTVQIYSNTENITLSDTHWDKINKLISDEKIIFHHLTSDKFMLHSKIYVFKKNKKIVFIAVGSPNFSFHSNQSFEFLYTIFDHQEIDEIWSKIKLSFQTFKIPFSDDTPEQVITGIKQDDSIEDRFLENLWLHQKAIIKWMVRRNKMVINVPPGCGKTKIAITYMKYLCSKFKDISILVLVPTRTLISQWISRLNDNGFQSFEAKNWHDKKLEHFFGDPYKKAIVTLYSPRFLNNYNNYLLQMGVIKPKLLIISDECHNLYGNIDKYNTILNKYHTTVNNSIYQVGLSATLDSFNVTQVDEFKKSMDGEKNIYEISLQSFYSKWNNKNKTPILKNFRYIPITYSLSSSEMKKYNELSRKVARQYNVKNIDGERIFAAAIERARKVRSLEGGVNALESYLESHMDIFSEGSTLIFVQTNNIAERIRDFITSRDSWDRNSSAYVFDSKRSEIYREYALKQFKKNYGYCLIAEKMLSEGFDIPKINRIVIHGSDKSERDWIQKIGRALRYDSKNPNSIAEIIDIVFCDTNGKVLPMEEERYNILSATSAD